MANQKTGAPTVKVVSGTVGAAIATLVIWGLKAAGADLGDGVDVAITTVIVFAFGWFIPPAAGDLEV